MADLSFAGMLKIGNSVWEYKRAVGKPFTGKALDVATKSMIMQKGLENFTYKTLCSEILTRAELLAPRDVVLSPNNGRYNPDPKIIAKARETAALKGRGGKSAVGVGDWGRTNMLIKDLLITR